MSQEKQALDADGNYSSSGRPRPDVIIVTEASGRERRFAADRWNLEKHGLTVHRDHDVIARYQPHAWLSVREDGAEPPDSTAVALGIARLALERIAATDGSVVDTAALWKIAQDAIEGIWTETEL